MVGKQVLVTVRGDEFFHWNGPMLWRPDPSLASKGIFLIGSQWPGDSIGVELADFLFQVFPNPSPAILLGRDQFRPSASTLKSRLSRAHVLLR